MSTRDRTILVATITVWLIAWVIWTAAWIYGDMPHDLVNRALRRILTCTFGGACCWVMKLLLDATHGRAIGQRIAAALSLCFIAALLYGAVNTLVFYVIAPRWGSIGFMGLFDMAELAGFLFFAWSGLYFAIDADAEVRDSRLRVAAAKTEALRARNQALAQQMNPHFLFNALNTLSGLIIEGQPARAERVTTALASLLRRSLETEPTDFVALRDELECVRRYLEIEQSRFEDRLLVDEHIRPELMGYSIPPMVLQPLVENSIKHGVARSASPVTLAISAHLHARELKIVVADDAAASGCAANHRGSGIGNEIVRERLQLLYSGRASLTCEAQSAGGFRSTLVIPAVPYVFA